MQDFYLNDIFENISLGFENMLYIVSIVGQIYFMFYIASNKIKSIRTG